MTQDETHDTGIPTRAIHEAYLSMQRAHREYRQARDSGADTQELQGVFQDAVLTFFELVRPHLRRETALSKYWHGNLPDYTNWDFDSRREAAQFVREAGTGVYQIQQHTDTAEIQQQVLADGGLDDFEAWHEYLSLSWDTERLVAVQGVDESEYFYQVLRCAVLPLQELDYWKARTVRERDTNNGFMAGESNEVVRKQFESPQKIITAKRLLAEAADKMNLLSRVDIDHDDGAIVNFDQSRDGGQAAYRNVDYSSSPDI